MNPVRPPRSGLWSLRPLLPTRSPPPTRSRSTSVPKVELPRKQRQRDGSWLCMSDDDSTGPSLYSYLPAGQHPTRTGLPTDKQMGGLVRATRRERLWGKRGTRPVGRRRQGILAFDSLYVSRPGPGRPAALPTAKTRTVTASPTTRRPVEKKSPAGAGEHGAHALVLGPDKKSIVIVGPATHRHRSYEVAAGPRPTLIWGEDELCSRGEDPVATSSTK